MAGIAEPSDFLDRAGEAFSLAGKLGRDLQEEHKRQRDAGVIEPDSWDKFAAVFEQLWRALVYLRGFMSDPPEGMEAIARELAEGAKIARKLRAALRKPETHREGLYFDFWPDLNTVARNGDQALEAARSALACDDPFQCLDGQQELQADGEAVTHEAARRVEEAVQKKDAAAVLRILADDIERWVLELDDATFLHDAEASVPGLPAYRVSPRLADGSEFLTRLFVGIEAAYGMLEFYTSKELAEAFGEKIDELDEERKRFAERIAHDVRQVCIDWPTLSALETERKPLREWALGVAKHTRLVAAQLVKRSVPAPSDELEVEVVATEADTSLSMAGAIIEGNRVDARSLKLAWLLRALSGELKAYAGGGVDDGELDPVYEVTPMSTVRLADTVSTSEATELAREIESDLGEDVLTVLDQVGEYLEDARGVAEAALVEGHKQHIPVLIQEAIDKAHRLCGPRLDVLASRLVARFQIGHASRKGGPDATEQSTTRIVGGKRVIGEPPELKTTNDVYVTLKEAAVYSLTSKKTLEGWKAKGKLPQPDVPHRGRRPARWLWNRLRPVLEKQTRMNLPESPPREVTED